jgi:transcriptional regulator with XRE-family HTH domain
MWCLEVKALDIPHLRSFRRQAIMSQEELAERSGVARDTISKLESGRRKAYPTTIRKLAAGLDVEPQLLLGGVEYLDEEPTEEPTRRPPEESEGGKHKKIGF